MAYSGNQNQPSFWGGRVLGRVGAQPTPRDSLRFWCVTHQRILELERTNPERVLLLNFNRLCREPIDVFRTLLNFVGVEPVAEVLECLSRRVSAPASIGRFKSFSLDAFEPVDVEFVRCWLGSGDEGSSLTARLWAAVSAVD